MIDSELLARINLFETKCFQWGAVQAITVVHPSETASHQLGEAVAEKDEARQYLLNQIEFLFSPESYAPLK